VFDRLMKKPLPSEWYEMTRYIQECLRRTRFIWADKAALITVFLFSFLLLFLWSLAFFVVSTQSGRLSERVGPRLMIAIGTGLIGCGSLVLALTNAGTPMALAQIGLMMAGVGMGLNTGPLYGIAIGSVGQERSGTASALINVARMVGATLGVALLGSVFALLHGGPAGLRAAMLVGGAVQLAGAAVAFATVR